MHIGLIGGIGPAATAYYYRRLVERHAAAGVPLELTIVHADLRELARNLVSNDTQRQAEVFAHLVRRLAAAGAHAAAVTSMGGHFCIGELEATSSLPILNAIPAVAASIRQQNLRKIGILGTRMVMESRLYGGISSAEIVVPEGEALELVHSSYVEMAMVGQASDAQRRAFFSVGRHLCHVQGAEAVILGGTDLFLAFDGQDCGFPMIDCAECHIEALCGWSTGRDDAAG
jgi:aspartate racemase